MKMLLHEVPDGVRFTKSPEWCSQCTTCTDLRWHQDLVVSQNKDLCLSRLHVLDRKTIRIQYPRTWVDVDPLTMELLEDEDALG